MRLDTVDLAITVVPGPSLSEGDRESIRELVNLAYEEDLTPIFRQLEPVAYIEDWIDEGNLDAARATAMNPRWRALSVEQLNAGCRSYLDDHERFYGRLR